MSHEAKRRESTPFVPFAWLHPQRESLLGERSKDDGRRANCKRTAKNDQDTEHRVKHSHHFKHDHAKQEPNDR